MRYRRSKRHYQMIERNSHLLRKYGVNLQEVVSRLRVQGYKCAICECKLKAFGGMNKVSTAYVDHCHSTGQVRGLLCNTCNQGIGHLKNSPALCKQAARYLQ